MLYRLNHDSWDERITMMKKTTHDLNPQYVKS